MLKTIRNLLIVVVLGLSGSILYVLTTAGEMAKSKENITIIRIGHDQPITNERHLAIKRFKELTEKKSNGQIEVLIYPNNQLGSEAEMIESVTLNDLQMVAASAFSQYDERISVFELPYLFDSSEQAWSVLDGEIGEKVGKLFLEDNLRILAYFENGFRHVTANKPIETPADMKGLKIRTPEFPISLSTFNAFDANPTPMAFGELYTALQQGTVDAQENPIANTYTSKFQEVQEYMNLTKHQYFPLPVAINEEFWESLSPDLQAVIEDSSKEAAQYHRETIKKNEEKQMDELEEEGMEIIEPDTTQFKDNVDDVYNAFKKTYGDELVDQVLKAAKENE